MKIEMCIAIIQGTFTLVAAISTAWFALWFYHKQKEYELVKQRYLEGSVDVIASEIDNSLGIFNHNWARCLNLVKAYRDQEDNFDIKELDSGFIEYEVVNFHQIEHHRLFTLTGTLIYWKMYQLILAFVTSSVSVMQHEIPDAIKTKLTTEKIEAEHSAIVEEAFKHLAKLQKDSHRFARFSGELNNLAAILEQEKLSVKKIQDFKLKDEVKKSISCIKETYKDDLNDSEDEGANQIIQPETPC